MNVIKGTQKNIAKLKALRFKELFMKYLKITLRNKQNYFWIFGYPLLFMALFSIAFTDSGRSAYDIVLINMDTERISEENLNLSLECNASMYIENLFEDDNFSKSFRRITTHSNGTAISLDDARLLLQQEKIDALVVIPQNFSELIIGNTWWYRALKNGADISALGSMDPLFMNYALWANTTTDFESGTPTLEVYTTADQVTQMVVSNVFKGIIYELTLQYNNITSAQVSLQVSVDQDTLTPFDYLAPGLVAVGVLVAISNVASMFAFDRYKGIMTRLDTTPVPRSTQMLSGATAQLIFSGIQIVILLASLLLFGVKIHEHADWLLAFVIAFALSFPTIGLGLIVAAISKSPDSAGGLSWIFILPLQFLGGGFWQTSPTYSKYFPSYYAINGLRSVLVYGLNWS